MKKIQQNKYIKWLNALDFPKIFAILTFVLGTISLARWSYITIIVIGFSIGVFYERTIFAILLTLSYFFSLGIYSETISSNSIWALLLIHIAIIILGIVTSNKLIQKDWQNWWKRFKVWEIIVAVLYLWLMFIGLLYS